MKRVGKKVNKTQVESVQLGKNFRFRFLSFHFPPNGVLGGLRMSSVPKPGWSSECLCRISAS